ncbi:MAG: hypothetical protein ACI9Y7_001845 [Dokdonia sp.]|jgi:hypothetical protein
MKYSKKISKKAKEVALAYKYYFLKTIILFDVAQ